MEWVGQNAMKIGVNRVPCSSSLFFVALVELRRVAEAQNLPRRMPRKNAVWPLGLERDDGDIPGTGAISGGDTPTRQTFERFELENGACRPDGADRRRCWCCHYRFLPSPSRPVRLTSTGPHCNPGTSYSVRQAIGIFGSPRQGSP